MTVKSTRRLNFKPHVLHFHLSFTTIRSKGRLKLQKDEWTFLSEATSYEVT